MATLKTKVDKLYIDKLVPVSVDLSNKLSDVEIYFKNKIRCR